MAWNSGGKKGRGVFKDIDSNVLMLCDIRLFRFNLRQLLPYHVSELLQQTKVLSTFRSPGY